MQAYAGDSDVFIRSMASRGHAGGLASTTTSAAAVLDAAGFDLVLIETVGTGQSEVEVAAAADTTVVLEAPEMGDEVQAIKAGLLEVADLVVVNKGDKPGAQRTAAQLRAMLVAVGVGADGATDARPRRSAPRSWSRPPRPATACRSCSRRSTGIARRPGRGDRGAARRARATAQVRAVLADRLADRSGCRHAALHGPVVDRGRRTSPRPVCRRRPPPRAMVRTTGERAVTRRTTPAPRLLTPAVPGAVRPRRSRSSRPAGMVLPVATRFAAGPLGARTRPASA